MLGEAGYMAEVVNLVLDNGTSQGLTVANIPNWVGVAVYSPRNLLDRLRTRPEIHRAGIYFLAGPDPEIDGAMHTYIGQGDVIWDRISKHHKDKDFWNIVIGVSTKTAEINLDKGHMGYLEALAIGEAKKLGRATLNQNSPKVPKLDEATHISMDAFYDKMKKLLSILGYPYLNPILEEIPSGDGDTGHVFVIDSKGVKARSIHNNAGLVVLKGSQASKKDAPSWTNAKSLRNRLIQEGALKDTGECLVFTRNVVFNSASQAANVVLARQSPGPREWKDSKTGETYKEIFSKLIDD